MEFLKNPSNNPSTKEVKNFLKKLHFVIDNTPNGSIIKSVKREEERKMQVKNWFINEKFNQQEAYVISVSELTVIDETEKAVKIYADSDYGHLKFWCPKSCIITDEEIAKQEEELDKKFKKGLEYNKSLVTFAKNNGIKGVREGLRTVTLIEKIKAAGLEVPARA